MRTMLLACALAWFAAPVAAQSGGSPFTADGMVGISHIVAASAGQDVDGLYGIDFAFDVRHRRHGLGFRSKALVPLLFGRSQVLEFGGIYSYRLVGGLAVGAGLSYVSEVYYSDRAEDHVRDTRTTVPTEVTLRIPYPTDIGALVRLFANLSDGRSFGGLSLGFSF